ncbi:MAG: hypothetical protein AAFX50_13445, partial [Acidobacteriota bacterium]
MGGVEGDERHREGSFPQSPGGGAELVEALDDGVLGGLLEQGVEDAVVERLDQLRASSRRLREAPLSMALVTLDATHGDVLAYVG